MKRIVYLALMGALVVTSGRPSAQEVRLEDPPQDLSVPSMLADDPGTPAPRPVRPEFGEKSGAKPGAKLGLKGKKKPSPSKRKKAPRKKKRSELGPDATGRRLASVGPGELAYVVPVAAPVEIPRIETVETEVHTERTSFEGLVRGTGRHGVGRGPAALKVTARVIGVRRELALTRAQADQAPQDIILNGGTKAGLSEGMKLSLMRRMPVLDPYRDNQQGEIEVEFGRVKVIHAQDDLAVARVENIESIRDGLVLSVRGPLVGDFVGPAK